MKSATAMQTEEAQSQTLEAAIHKLKLQWMMAKDDAERRALSEEIRRRLASPSLKQP